MFDGVEMLQNECLTLDYNLLTELCSILLKKECRFGQTSLIFEITGWILCNFVANSLRINYRQIFWRNSLDSQQTYVKVFLCQQNVGWEQGFRLNLAEIVGHYVSSSLGNETIWLFKVINTKYSKYWPYHYVLRAWKSFKVDFREQTYVFKSKIA